MSNEVIHIAWYVFVVALSVVVAEIARGYTAYKEGDSTPKNARRLNFNFFTHIDIVGSLLLPLTLLVSKSGFVIGWARHIPYNEHNFKNSRKSVTRIALSGIFVHIVLAVLATLYVRFFVSSGIFSGRFVEAGTSFAIANYLLALFNLIPLPPLDGAKIFLPFIPQKYEHTRKVLEFYSVPILVILIVLLWQYMFPTIDFLFKLITGVHITPT